MRRPDRISLACRAQHAFAQTAQAPARPGGLYHGTPGDMHHVMGQQCSEQANFIAGEV